ncbi:MAG: hypothetical protein MUE41_03065 [Gemmatimonadaceae bacterium]|nr:hypothetical protein [Gemmatimonadaceae bacterium]
MPRWREVALLLALAGPFALADAQSGTPRRGPFATRPAVAGSLGVMLPQGELAERYDWGPTFKGSLHIPLRGRILMVAEGAYARLPVLEQPVDGELPTRDGQLVGGAAHLIVPIGGSRLPVPGLGRGAPYLLGGGGLYRFDRERRTESFRPSAVGGLGLSFDAPGFHEAFIEVRVMGMSLTEYTAVMIPITAGFRW